MLDSALQFVPVFVLVVFRLAGMMLYAPLFGSARIPKRIRVMMLLVLAAINKSYRGLQDRDAVVLKQSEVARSAQEARMQTGATGVSRVTRETERVGNSLYTYAALPFEIASLLLLVAIIGSVMLARTLKQEAAVDDVDPEVRQTIAGVQELEGQG